MPEVLGELRPSRYFPGHLRIRVAGAFYLLLQAHGFGHRGFASMAGRRRPHLRNRGHETARLRPPPPTGGQASTSSTAACNVSSAAPAPSSTTGSPAPSTSSKPWSTERGRPPTCSPPPLTSNGSTATTAERSKPPYRPWTSTDNAPSPPSSRPPSGKASVPAGHDRRPQDPHTGLWHRPRCVSPAPHRGWALEAACPRADGTRTACRPTRPPARARPGRHPPPALTEAATGRETERAQGPALTFSFLAGRLSPLIIAARPRPQPRSVAHHDAHGVDPWDSAAANASA